MSARYVYEIFRRSVGTPASLGIVSDDFLARQVVDRLYEEMRQQASKPAGQMALAEAGFEAYNIQAAASDFSTWSVNDKNGVMPTFFYVKKLMWNAVPASLKNWILSEDPRQLDAGQGQPDMVIEALNVGTE